MVADVLVRAIAGLEPDRVFFFVDPASGFDVGEAMGVLRVRMPELPEPTVVEAEVSEEYKTLGQAEMLLAQLTTGGATRRSVLVCVGGGMTTDLGGFAAAVFKRGIRYGNVATTILGAVDAAVGGKTAVNFLGLKNEVGAFHMPSFSLADVGAMATLPRREVLSGFGEVVKCVLIGFSRFAALAGVEGLPPVEALGGVLEYCRPEITDMERLARLIDACAELKENVVREDPRESGLRKILNFGHTAGHALEELMLERMQSDDDMAAVASGIPVKGASLSEIAAAHGVAVAHGILIALILSERLLGLDRRIVSIYARWLRGNYPPMPITCSDYDALWHLARHDKKNTASDDALRFVLLRALGDSQTDVAVGRRAFEAALDLYQELQGR